MPRPAPRPLLGSALAGLLVAACSWSVPADPGEQARLAALAAPPSASPAAADHGPTTTSAASAPAAGADAGARAIYVARCGQCHAPFAPSHAPAARWPSIVRHYGPRAGLFGAERERVVRWLQASAGR
jgi:hypothetical protein